MVEKAWHCVCENLFTAGADVACFKQDVLDELTGVKERARASNHKGHRCDQQRADKLSCFSFFSEEPCGNQRKERKTGIVFCGGAKSACECTDRKNLAVSCCVECDGGPNGDSYPERCGDIYGCKVCMLHRKGHHCVNSTRKKPCSLITKPASRINHKPDCCGAEEGSENACRDQGLCRGGDSGKRLCDDFEGFQNMDKRPGGEEVPLTIVIKTIIKLAGKNV